MIYTAIKYWVTDSENFEEYNGDRIRIHHDLVYIYKERKILFINLHSSNLEYKLFFVIRKQYHLLVLKYLVNFYLLNFNV